MANSEHVKQLGSGPEAWSKWRTDHQGLIPDLSGLDFRKTQSGRVNLVFGSGLDHRFDEFDFRKSNLDGAVFGGVNVRGMLLMGASLRGCDLSSTDFSGCDLCSCDFSDSNLSGCRFDRGNLRGTILVNSNLELASFAETNLVAADLSGSRIYGVSVWGGNLQDAVQQDMVIATSDGSISLDNIALAQFVYLLMNNEGVRSAIDTLASKTVLILGRFSVERKKVLDELRGYVRENGYVPLLFDFDKPAHRSLTETVRTLAGISKFVIVDLTDPRSVPHELQMIIPHLTSVPVQPLIEDGSEPYGMFADYSCYPWVLPLRKYVDTPNDLKKVVANTVDGVNEFIASKGK